MAITATQRHTPAESVNERTSGRRIEAYQQFIAFRITETGNTDATGKFTLTNTPVGSLSRQFDTLGRLNKEPDMVVLTAADALLYTGTFDLDNRTIELYIDAAKTIPAANLVGVKVSYWYYAPVKGTLNADGTFTPDVSIDDLGGAATEAKQDALIAKDFATQATLADVLAKLSADPATQTTLAAILSALQGTINTELTGSNVSIEERLWLSTDPDPVPVSNRALGVVIDVATNEMTTKYWDGTSWEEVR